MAGKSKRSQRSARSNTSTARSNNSLRSPKSSRRAIAEQAAETRKENQLKEWTSRYGYEGLDYAVPFEVFEGGHADADASFKRTEQLLPLLIKAQALAAIAYRNLARLPAETTRAQALDYLFRDIRSKIWEKERAEVARLEQLAKLYKEWEARHGKGNNYYLYFGIYGKESKEELPLMSRTQALEAIEYRKLPPLPAKATKEQAQDYLLKDIHEKEAEKEKKKAAMEWEARHGKGNNYYLYFVMDGKESKEELPLMSKVQAFAAIAYRKLPPLPATATKEQAQDYLLKDIHEKEVEREKRKAEEILEKKKAAAQILLEDILKSSAKAAGEPQKNQVHLSLCTIRELVAGLSLEEEADTVVVMELPEANVVIGSNLTRRSPTADPSSNRKRIDYDFSE